MLDSTTRRILLRTVFVVQTINIISFPVFVLSMSSENMTLPMKTKSVAELYNSNQILSVNISAQNRVSKRCIPLTSVLKNRRNEIHSNLTAGILHQMEERKNRKRTKLFSAEVMSKSLFKRTKEDKVPHTISERKILSAKISQMYPTAFNSTLLNESTNQKNVTDNPLIQIDAIQLEKDQNNKSPFPESDVLINKTEKIHTEGKKTPSYRLSEENNQKLTTIYEETNSFENFENTPGKTLTNDSVMATTDSPLFLLTLQNDLHMITPFSVHIDGMKHGKRQNEFKLISPSPEQPIREATTVSYQLENFSLEYDNVGTKYAISSVPNLEKFNEERKLINLSNIKISKLNANSEYNSDKNRSANQKQEESSPSEANLMEKNPTSNLSKKEEINNHQVLFGINLPRKSFFERDISEKLSFLQPNSNKDSYNRPVFNMSKTFTQNKPTTIKNEDYNGVLGNGTEKLTDFQADEFKNLPVLVDKTNLTESLLSDVPIIHPLFKVSDLRSFTFSTPKLKPNLQMISKSASTDLLQSSNYQSNVPLEQTTTQTVERPETIKTDGVTVTLTDEEKSSFTFQSNSNFKKKSAEPEEKLRLPNENSGLMQNLEVAPSKFGNESDSGDEQISRHTLLADLLRNENMTKNMSVMDMGQEPFEHVPENMEDQTESEISATVSLLETTTSSSIYENESQPNSTNIQVGLTNTSLFTQTLVLPKTKEKSKIANRTSLTGKFGLENLKSSSRTSETENHHSTNFKISSWKLSRKNSPSSENLHSLSTDENLKLSVSKIIPESIDRLITKKHGLKTLQNSRKNLLKINTGNDNSILMTESRRLSSNDNMAPTESKYIIENISSLKTPTTDLKFDKIFTENWKSTSDLDYVTEFQESLEPENFSPIIMLFNNSGYLQPHDSLKQNTLRKKQRILTDETIPPMNPNENWRRGENDTYYTIKELQSLFHSKTKDYKTLRDFKNLVNETSPQIIIDLNGKQNQTCHTHQNESNLNLNSTKYKILKMPFSNESFIDECVRNELLISHSNFTSRSHKEDLSIGFSKGESKTSELSHKLQNSSIIRPLNINSSRIETQKLEVLKSLKLTKNDEKAFKFLEELSSLNETFLPFNLSVIEKKLNISTGIVFNTEPLYKSGENIQITLMHSKDPATEILKKQASGSNKVTALENEFQPFKDDGNPERKTFMKGKSVSSTERDTDVKDESSSARFLSEIHHKVMAKPYDPQEQMIKKQFHFVNPRIVDNFLDVYKRYSPQYSASKSKMKQRNYAGSNEGINWIRRTNKSYKTEPPADNFIENLLRELRRLRNFVPTAYASHYHDY